MAGGHAKYRHLSRSSPHRQSLLRNLVTSLFKHSTITTTLAKAKEASRLAEKLITLGKKNTSASRRRAHQIFFEPVKMVPRLLRISQRYLERPGGYTRVLRTGPRIADAGDGAVLSLVDGERDVRRFLTAQTVARDRELGVPHTAITEGNIAKLTNEAIVGVGAKERFERLVEWYGRMEEQGAEMPVQEEVRYGKGQNVVRGHADDREEEMFYPANGLERKYGGRAPEPKGWARRKNGLNGRRIVVG